MNQRILELKNQAIDEINQEHLSCPENIAELIDQRFAELIVKECLDAVGDGPMERPAIQRIKAQFGVKYYEPIEKAFGAEK